MAEPDFLAGQTLTAGKLRSIAPWTLLFSGNKSIASNASTSTVVDTLANVVTNTEIPYTITSGVITLTDGGLFLVSLVGSWASNGAGSVRRVHVRGSVFLEGRCAPFSFPTSATGGTGAHNCGAAPIMIEPGENIDVLARQDSGGALVVTAWLGLTKLASLPA
jgi:hypothetical protein